MRIFFFAQLRDLVGTDQADLEADGINEDELWDLLEQRWPVLSSQRAAVRVACNGSYAAKGGIFRDGDEVALIPPVSGG